MSTVASWTQQFRSSAQISQTPTSVPPCLLCLSTSGLLVIRIESGLARDRCQNRDVGVYFDLITNRGSSRSSVMVRAQISEAHGREVIANVTASLVDRQVGASVA